MVTTKPEDIISLSMLLTVTVNFFSSEDDELTILCAERDRVDFVLCSGPSVVIAAEKVYA